MKKIIVIQVLSFLLAAASATALEFHVAPGGDDAAAGTKEHPFATLVRARDAVRTANRAARTPVDVVLHGGVYSLEEPLVLGPEDSGTATCPVTYTAYPGEKPVISGGRAITGWKKSGPGELWTAEIPEVKQGKWYFRQLHVNGQRRPSGRLPAHDLYQVAGKAEPKLRAFKFAPGQIDPKWRNLDDVAIVLPQFWAESRMRIASIDEAAGVVHFTGDGFRPMDWTQGWYAENVFEGLTEPGMWYLDRQAGVLYYWPLPSEKVEELEFVAPVTKQWLRLEGDYKTDKLVEYVTFRGLTFQYSSWEMDKKLGYSYFQNSIEETPGQKIVPGWDWPALPADDKRLSGPQQHVPVPSAIWAIGAHHVRFEDNTIAHTGAWAIHLAQGGCKDNHIVGNNMSDLGAGAIRVGGPDTTNDDAEETGRTVVADNRIHDCAKVYFGAPAIFVGQSSNNLVAHNEITGWCEWAITLGWAWGYFPGNAHDNIVEYNHVHHYGGSVLANHSAMYAMGVQPGTVFRYNLIRDNLSDRSNGIILDAGAAAMRVESNVVHNILGLGMVMNHDNFGHVVQNNIFANCGTLVTRAGDPGPMGSTGTLYRNIFYYDSTKGQKVFQPDPWGNYDAPMNYNLYWDTSGKPPMLLGLGFDEWKEKTTDYWRNTLKRQDNGLDHDSIVADPMFIDPDHGDFRLKPESPALKLGFRQIDLNTVGVRPRIEKVAEGVKSALIKVPVHFGSAMENTPFIFNGQPMLVLNFRDDTKQKTDEYTKNMYLYIQDLCTGKEVARFGEGHSFVSAFVNGPELHVFASEGTKSGWFQSIYHFTSTDLKTWKRELAIPLEGDEHLFNCSVCRDDDGYVMAYESNLPVQFCFKFARSKDLVKWEKIPGLTFTGERRQYSACPVIRYYKPYYYVIYLHTAIPGHNGWVSFMARSKDLVAWQLTPKNPILEAGPGEGCNNSDVDLFEWEGNTYLYYATGDQQTWGSVRVALYPGPMQAFFETFFPEGAPMKEANAAIAPASPSDKPK